MIVSEPDRNVMELDPNKWERRPTWPLTLYTWSMVILLGIGMIVVLSAPPHARSLPDFIGRFVVFLAGIMILSALALFMQFNLGTIYFRRSYKLGTDDLYERIKLALLRENIDMMEETDGSGHRSLILDKWHLRLDIIPNMEYKNENRVRMMGVRTRNKAGAERIIALVDRILNDAGRPA